MRQKKAEQCTVVLRPGQLWRNVKHDYDVMLIRPAMVDEPGWLVWCTRDADPTDRLGLDTDLPSLESGDWELVSDT